MKLIGMMPVRNEAWVLGLSLRAALMWCDEVIVHLHQSTDASREIAYRVLYETRDGSRERVQVWDNADVEWNEMVHRQHMLVSARSRGATHLAIVDADEILSGNLMNDPPNGSCCMKGIMETIPNGAILQLPGYNLRGSIDRYHSNGLWANRWFSTAFADDPKLSWSGDKFHSREPQGKPLVPYRPIAQGSGGMMHLWGASERRLIAKHSLYKVTERLRWPHKPISEIELTYNDWRSPADNAKHWPSMKAWGEPWTFADVPAAWWQPYEHLVKHLDIDAEPWQEAEVRRLVELHGREKFAGLDLFGIA